MPRGGLPLFASALSQAISESLGGMAEGALTEEDLRAKLRRTRMAEELFPYQVRAEQHRESLYPYQERAAQHRESVYPYELAGAKAEAEDLPGRVEHERRRRQEEQRGWTRPQVSMRNGTAYKVHPGGEVEAETVRTPEERITREQTLVRQWEARTKFREMATRATPATPTEWLGLFGEYSDVLPSALLTHMGKAFTPPRPTRPEDVVALQRFGRLYHQLTQPEMAATRQQLQQEREKPVTLRRTTRERPRSLVTSEPILTETRSVLNHVLRRLSESPEFRTPRNTALYEGKMRNKTDIVSDLVRKITGLEVSVYQTGPNEYAIGGVWQPAETSGAVTESGPLPSMEEREFPGLREEE